jgi:1-acyl-sn-glycerol-3-phosphate acyltransferase
MIFAILNSLVCWIFIAIDTVFWGTISISSVLYSPSGRVAHFCMRGWSKTILWFCRVRIHVEGIENVAPDRVQIFAPNHASHFDIFILSHVLPVKFGWVAKAVLFKIPFLGWHMKLNGYISIDRSNRDKAIQSLNDAAEKVKSGNRIILFPEGTRSRKNELQPFKKGLFHLCVKTGVPIVPIYIKGSYNILAPDSVLIHSGDVYVKIGREMANVGYSEDNIAPIMNDLRARLLTLQKEVDDMEKRFSRGS